MFGCLKFLRTFISLSILILSSFWIILFFSIIFMATCSPVCLFTANLTVANVPSPITCFMIKSHIILSFCSGSLISAISSGGIDKISSSSSSTLLDSFWGLCSMSLILIIII